jgi:hypothetical protein
VRNRPGSCAAPSSATEHSCQPAAPRLPAFLGDQAAPHSVRADAEECRSESSRQSARTGHPAQIAMARVACSRARLTSAVSGNHSSGSRHEVAHHACRYTRPNSSRSFGSPDRHCTGRGETVATTGCTSSRSSPFQPHRRPGRPHPPTGWLTRLVIPAGRTIQVRDAATAGFLQSRISKGYRSAAAGRRRPAVGRWRRHRSRGRAGPSSRSSRAGIVLRIGCCCGLAAVTVIGGHPPSAGRSAGEPSCCSARA